MLHILLPIIAVAALYVFYTWRCLERNLDAAKKSGIPYIIAPFYLFNTFWLLTHRLWLPTLRRLPKAWVGDWLDFAEPDWPWDLKYTPFEKYNSPVLMIVAPGKISVNVADPDVIVQITTRRNDFPKPIEVYNSVNLFGDNVVGTEGSVWRHHRKITSPPFTEKSNVLVFQESIRQAQAMLAGWVGPQGGNSKTIMDVAGDAMRLSLHVISRAGFGVRLHWPHEEAGKDVALTNGHKLSYKDALHDLLENILAVMLLPRWILKNAPIKSVQYANLAFTEWGQYMNEMYQEKKADAAKGIEREGLDLMGALVKGAGGTHGEANDEKSAKGLSAGGLSAGGNALSPDEILGNAFVFILAGHETAANTIHFSLLYLAMNPASQRRLQHDLDNTGLTAKDPSDWDYETDVPKLFGGMTGAIMNEELRLIPPVISIPKRTHAPQPLTVAGRRCVVPANAAVNLMTAAVHRNPHAWPSNGPDDLLRFRPERWLVGGGSGTSTPREGGNGHINGSGPGHAASTLFADGEFGGPGGSDTAPSMLHPRKGAYIPFSEGARSCLGRRFAQVEILAVLAVIFREYSVELAVDEYASDEEVEKMGQEGRREVWGRARDMAEGLLEHGMGTIITIQMRKGRVGLRFVKRGGERFGF